MMNHTIIMRATELTDMPQFLTLSKASRLLGVSRETLQRDIRTGKLTTFEGMIELADLKRTYPSAVLDDTSAVERLQTIQNTALGKRGRDNLPREVKGLTDRAERLQKELDAVTGTLRWYTHVLDDLVAKLDELGETAGQDERVMLASLKTWLGQRLEK